MAVHADLSNREQLLAMASELQNMAGLIEKYPAEAQLVIAALEDGLTLGAMRVTYTDAQLSPSAGQQD